MVAPASAGASLQAGAGYKTRLGKSAPIRPAVFPGLIPRRTLARRLGLCYIKGRMVGVAQLAELQVVALAVAGSSPVAHPSEINGLGQSA